MKSLPERMRDAADVYEEARTRLPGGYSRTEYVFRPEDLRKFADSYEREDKQQSLVSELAALIDKSAYVLNRVGSRAEFIAKEILFHFDVTPK